MRVIPSSFLEQLVYSLLQLSILTRTDLFIAKDLSTSLEVNRLSIIIAHMVQLDILHTLSGSMQSALWPLPYYRNSYPGDASRPTF